jgi:hypothetical protein
MIIKDGAGSGFGALVDKNNRLHTESVSRDVLTEAVFQGDAYNFNTGNITLTTANESAVGYFKYNGEDPLVITEIICIISSTTGGSGDGTVRIYRNPTGGTIVDNELDVEISANRDFSSSKTVDGLIYKGAEGYTTTGGTIFADSSRSSFGTIITFDAAPIILKKGTSLSITWQPPAGNTSQIIKIAATGYISSSDVFA